MARDSGNIRVLKNGIVSCRTCLRATSRRHYRRHADQMRERGRSVSADRYVSRREFIDALKAVPCADCGSEYPGEPDLMQFDHRDPDGKVVAVSQMTGFSESRILAEAAKCDVVCALCHIRRTRAQRAEGLFRDGRPRVG